jgi:hypothetical protein
MAYLGRDAANAVTSPRRGVAGIRLTFVREVPRGRSFIRALPSPSCRSSLFGSDRSDESRMRRRQFGPPIDDLPGRE